MHEYYTVLEIPVDATQEQIKWQYKQLVRIYHPDRFQNENDKAFAAEKLRDINEAYDALSNLPKVSREQSLPVPVVTPNRLDFGTLTRGQRKSMTFRVDNLGYESQNVNFIYSEPHAWFKVSNGRRIYADKPLPMMIDVTAQTRRLSINQHHTGWLDVVMDGITQRLELEIRVLPRQKWSLPSFSLPKIRQLEFSWLKLSWTSFAKPSIPIPPFRSWLRWGAITLTTVAITAAILAAALSAFLVDIPLLQPTPTESISKVVVEQPLAFVSNENKDRIPTISRLGQNGDGPENLLSGGYAPSWSPQGDRVAYLSKREGIVQLHVAGQEDLSSSTLYENAYPVSQIKWSPDGRRLAFLGTSEPSTESDKSNLHKLHWLNTYTTNLKSVVQDTSDELSEITYFAWHPDSESLIYDVRLGNEQFIYHSNVDGPMLYPSKLEGWTASISHDGDSMVFGTKDGLMLFSDFDTDSPTESTLRDQVVWHPTWSPDDSHIAFLGWDSEQYIDLEGIVDPNKIDTEPDLWVMEADGDNVRRLTHNGISNYAWSPTGQQIAYVTGSSVLYLWAIDLQSRNIEPVVEVSDPNFTWLYNSQ